MPRALGDREIGHTGLTKLHVVRSMHERKATMPEVSEDFIALPGGNGTLEEFFEVFTWVQLGEHAKPYGLLEVSGYYDPLLTVFEQMVGRTFRKREHRKLVLVEEDPSALLERFGAYEPRRGPSSGPTTRRDEP
jgi:uncharacterized protein (TIGR00730 family)